MRTYAHLYIFLFVIALFSCTKETEKQLSFEETIAQAPCKTCDDFVTQAEAKNYIENLRPDCAEGLFRNDSICPDLPVSGSDIDYTRCLKCSDFATAEEATAYALDNKPCSFFLDLNGNGVYCEKGETRTDLVPGCKSCEDFNSFEAAFVYSLVKPSCADSLEVHNFLLCDSLPFIATDTLSCKTCDDFTYREEAQLHAFVKPSCGEELFSRGKYCPDLPSLFVIYSFTQDVGDCRKCEDFTTALELSLYVTFNPSCSESLKDCVK